MPTFDDAQAWGQAFAQRRCDAYERCGCYGLGGFQFPDIERCSSSLDSYYQERAAWALSVGAQLNPQCLDLLEARVFGSVCESVPPASVSDVWEAQTCKLFAGMGTLGAACESSPASVVPVDDTCAEGLYCRAGQCAEIPEEGEACVADAEWSRCSGTTQCQDGVCQPYPGVGDPCGLPGCGDGAYCNDGTCEVAPAAGEACGVGGACATSVCLDDRCAPPRPDVCGAVLF